MSVGRLVKRTAYVLFFVFLVSSLNIGSCWAGVWLSSPASGSTVSGTVTVTLNPDPGSAWSNWYVDGIYQGSTPPMSFSWNTTSVANGSHSLLATAFDSSANPTGSGGMMVTVANGAKSSGAVSLNSPSDGSTVSGTVTIAVSNSGATSWSNIYIDGVYVNSTPPSTFSWNTAALANGSHQVKATAFDASANNLGTASATVTVANGSSSGSSSSSAVTITSPSSGSTVSGTVNIAYNEGSGTSWVNLYIDGNYLASSPPTTVSWSSSAVSNGSHTISAKAYNSSGSNIGASTATVTVSNGSSSGSSGGHFSTLPPGSSLPSGDQCASMVRFSSFEPRPDNYTANHTVPSDLSAMRGAGGTISSFIDRVDGNFTGTTDEILQWGACKWGFDEDLVRAIAVEETHWRQPAAGDFTYNTSLCPSGAVYSGGGCYQTYGIVQIKAPDFVGTFPNSTQSTAFAVDYKLAYQRACYEGQVSYLSGISSDYPSSSSYDMLWGCVDQWLTGGWWSGSDDGYISDIKGFMSNKPWLSPNF
jgi:Bacterial Ig domain